MTKRFGERLAVDRLTATVRPGVVTGFLGPKQILRQPGTASTGLATS